MRVSDCLGCNGFPCEDVNHSCYLIPNIDINPENILIVMISEAAPPDPKDYFYAGGAHLAPHFSSLLNSITDIVAA